MGVAVSGRPGTVLVYDTTERRAPWLSRWWSLGSLISRSAVVIPAASWSEAYDRLGEIRDPVDLVQVWGHGDDGAPLIAGRDVNLRALAGALPTLHPASELWWRSCEVHRGAAGRQFAADAVRILGCVSVGHCKVISWPNPLRQAAICALRPTDPGPWWDPSGAGLPGAWLSEMDVPSRAYTPLRADS